ncbi:MAG TPA: phytanoyl-CoA dioxygenase family protein [Polyangiaceae bacterium]
MEEHPVHPIALEGFWREHFPALSIHSRLAGGDAPRMPVAAAQVARWRERIVEEGFFREATDVLRERVPRLADGVRTCRTLGLPPPFLFLFDETWEAFHALDPMLQVLLGEDYRILPDFWTWHLDPASNESGWEPHRDRGRGALGPGGAPVSLTVWIALTESTPENGCIYVLPANRDPTYGTPREDQPDIDVTKVRALPAAPGEFLCWNQAVLHWGGQASRFAGAARISMALEFQSGRHPPFNTPLLPRLANIPFAVRLRLVAKQLLQYTHVSPLTPEVTMLARDLLATPA